MKLLPETVFVGGGLIICAGLALSLKNANENRVSDFGFMRCLT